MLRQQELQMHKSGLSASSQFVDAAANARFCQFGEERSVQKSRFSLAPHCEPLLFALNVKCTLPEERLKSV